MVFDHEKPRGIESPEGPRGPERLVPEAVRRAREAADNAVRERAAEALNERIDVREALQGVIAATSMEAYREAAVKLQPHLDALSASERKALRAKSDAMSMGGAVMGSVEELTAVNVIAERVRRWKKEAEEQAAKEPPSVVARFLRKGPR